MKSVRCFTIVLLLNLVAAESVLAGGLAERIKTWFFGAEAQAATVAYAQPRLDHVGQRCVECHNGVHATEITVKSAEAPPHYSLSGMQVNHPVGMIYDDYAITDARYFTSRFLLNGDINLVDGKVTCVSCHRLRNREGPENSIEARWNESPSAWASPESCNASSELTVGPREEDLCLACHIL